MPEYLVNLAVRVEAESPDKASVAMIGHLVENGLTDWAYLVSDPETQESLGVYDGYGLEVDTEKQTPVQTDPEEKPSDVGQQEVTDEESDAALLSLATDLNSADEPQPSAES